MSIILRKEIARILIIAFVFFLIPSDSFSVKKDEKTGLKLIKQAEKLFKNYKYQDSINKFRDAEKYVKLEKNLSRLYLGISRSYYAIGLMSQVKEAINKLAMLSVKSSFKKSKYPRGYLKIYNDIQAEIERKKREEQIVKTEEESESLYQVEATGEETKEITKKSLAGVIEKPGKKKKKKKSLLLPITLGAVALGAVVMLMGKKSGDDIGSDTASVHIESYPSDADVYVDGVSKNVRTPCNITVPVEEETEIKLVIDGWGETAKNQRYSKGNSYTLNAQLAPYKYVSEQNITMFPETNPNSWDCDSEGNLYAVSQSGNVFIDKYDQPVMGYSSTIELDRTFDLSKAWFFIEQDISRFYFLNYKNQRIDSVYIFDFSGNSMDQFFNFNDAYDLTRGPDGTYYVLVGGNKVSVRDGSMNQTSEFSLNSPFPYKSIKASKDNNGYLYLGNESNSSIYKYSVTGEYISHWQGTGGFSASPYYLHCFGWGDREKVFFRSESGGNKRMEIFNGDTGTYLTKTSDRSYVTRITGDSDGSVFVGTGERKVTRYEATGAPEGDGTWETSSVASTISRIGSHGTTRIDPFKSKRLLKPDIDKDRGKRGKKDL